MTAPVPSSSWRRWNLRLFKSLVAASAILVLFVATVIGLFRMAAPLVPGYRTELEQWASAAINRPVDIRSMSADWGWIEPEITLTDVRIMSRDRSRVIIQAREVRLGVSLWSLLHGQLPKPNRIVLVEPRLELERDEAGVFSIRGLEGVTHATTDWHQFTQDAFGQSAIIVVDDGHLTYFEAGSTAGYLFDRIDLKVDNETDSHRLTGSLQLPPAFGRILKFEIGISGAGIDPARWDWDTRVRGDALVIPRFLAYWPAYRDRFVRGDADIDAELTGSGSGLQRVHGVVTARDVVPAAHGFPAAGTEAFGLLQGDVDWTRTGSGWTLTGKRVQLQHGQRTWPMSQFRLALDESAGLEDWEGDASFLQLEDLTQLTGWLEPVLAADAARVRHFAPSGSLSGLAFKLQRRDGQIDDWSVQAQFQDLGIQAAEGWPGFSGMDGKLELDGHGGLVTLASRDASVDFRPLFRWPMKASSLDADIHVTHDAQGWRVASQGFKVANEDASADGSGSMFFPSDGTAPRLDIDATAHNAHAKGKSVYFPVGIMDKQVVDWLDSSIVAGEVPVGTVSVHGKTSDFPYDHGGGVFDIRFHLLHGELDYAPGWPAVKDLDADVRFYDQGLSVQAHSGTIQGDAIHDATARFADLRTGVLEIAGGARGSAGNALDFLRTGPLKERFGHYLDPLKAVGGCDVTLQLTLPVEDLDKFELHGTGDLQAAGVTPSDLPGLSLQNLDGQFEFTGNGFSAKRITGTLLGAPVTIGIRPVTGSKAGMALFTADGAATADALAALFKSPPGTFTGRTPWHLEAQVPDDPAASSAGFSVSLRSSLQGLAIALPAPFGKEADGPTPLNFSMKLASERNLNVTGNWSGRIRSRINFAEQQGQWQLDRGAVTVGGGVASLPATPGLVITGELADFDWDAWQPYLPSGSSGTGPALPDWLHEADFTLQRFSGFGQSTGPMHLTLSKDEAGWQARIDSPAVTGTADIPQAVDADHPLKVDLDKLVLAKMEHPKTEGSGPATPTRYDPRHVPALDFSSRHVQYGDVNLDGVQAKFVPLADGVALQNLKVDNSNFTLTGSGTWIVTSADLQQSTLSIDMKSHDVAKTMQSLGYAAAITGDQAEINTSLNWQDGPLGPDVVKTLGGTLHIKLEDGQLVDVQPGAGRVFGLLSINALPRRLLLNFSDVFAKGFGYDSIEGHFTIKDGDAYTPDLTIAGPAAKIHIVGRTGLAKHDFDEALVVDASVGSTLPVVGALAAGVGVGAVVFLLTEIFKKPLTAAGEVRYHLTGTWDNPVLTKVAEASKAPSPATRP